jgi:hypothetical protein
MWPIRKRRGSGAISRTMGVCAMGRLRNQEAEWYCSETAEAEWYCSEPAEAEWYCSEPAE